MNKNKVRELLHSLPKNVIFQDEELLYFFMDHPKWNEKTHNGFDGFIIKKNEWNFSFHVVDKIGIHTPISFNFDIKETEKHRVIKALRNEVQPIVDEYRNKLVFGVSRCDVTGEILTKTNTHIDHFDLEFRFLAQYFMEKYPNIEVNKIGVKFYIANEDIKDEWIKYHNLNTKLRAVTASFNLSRNKK
jgi:hypothetical protein